MVFTFVFGLEMLIFLAALRLLFCSSLKEYGVIA